MITNMPGDPIMVNKDILYFPFKYSDASDLNYKDKFIKAGISMTYVANW
jgi:hypothetical protein